MDPSLLLHLRPLVSRMGCEGCGHSSVLVVFGFPVKQQSGVFRAENMAGKAGVSLWKDF